MTFPIPPAIRQTLHMIFIGTNGTGKTTLVKNSFVVPSRRRVLIVDPDLLEPAWNKYKIIDLADAQAMRKFSGIRRAGCNGPDDLKFIVENYNNGSLVLDDFGFYTQAGIFQPLRQLLVRRRQKVLDIFSLCHGFTNIPPAFLLYMTHICIFKTLDNPIRHREKLPPAAFESLLKTIQMVNASPDLHKPVIVDMKRLTQSQI